MTQITPQPINHLKVNISTDLLLDPGDLRLNLTQLMLLVFAKMDVAIEEIDHKFNLLINGESGSMSIRVSNQQVKVIERPIWLCPTCNLPGERRQLSRPDSAVGESFGYICDNEHTWEVA